MTTPEETPPSFAGPLWELKRHFPLQLMDRGYTVWSERESAKQAEIATLKRQALHKTVALIACMMFLSVRLFLLRQEISDFMHSGVIQCNPPTVARGLFLAGSVR